jgi:hypothetical protein
MEMRVHGLAFVALLAASSAMAQNSYPTNSAGFYYKNTFQNIESYKQPTALLVAGECNRDHAQFAEARAKGAEVLAYINVVERQADPDVCDAYREFYTVSPGQYAAYWPFPYLGHRINYQGETYTTYLLDIRAGQAWPDRVVAFVEQLIREDKVDGVFLDVLGARLWGPRSDWMNDIDDAEADQMGIPRSADWTQTERDAWTNGAVDLVRRLDALRRSLNPKFIIVNNNSWSGAGGDWDEPANNATGGNRGRQYVDGIVREHHASTEAAQTNYARAEYSNLGHRRVIIIANSAGEEKEWRKKQGVTHVTQSAIDPATGKRTYAYAPPPTPPDAPAKTFNRLTDRLRAFGLIHETNAVYSDGMTANRKRASKFTMTENGQLLSLWAYVDGDGGVITDDQEMRLVLYRDNGGAPGAKVAESSTKWFAPGAPVAWRSFTVPEVPLAAGAYWIAIFTGVEGGVVRNYGVGGTNNWIANDDTFAGGASDPFGGNTSTGSVTLAVYATYRVVQ